MADITLQATKRDPKAGKAKDLRASGQVPVVLYGHKVENETLSCTYQELHKAFVKAGESTIIDLKTDKATVPVLFHRIDLNPVSGEYEHVDFFAPDMTKEITTHVAITAIGESPAVKDLGGVLVKHRESIEVKCLPKDLPHQIEVDLSSMEELNSHIAVSGITVPAGVTVMLSEDEMLFVVQPPRKEEEIKPAEEE